MADLDDAALREEAERLACQWFDCEESDGIPGDTSYHRASRGEHRKMENFILALRARVGREALEEAATVALKPSGYYQIGTNAQPYWDGNVIASEIRALAAEAGESK